MEDNVQEQLKTVREEMGAIRERLADMTIAMGELIAREEARDRFIDTLSDSVDVYGDYCITHAKHHDAVLKITRGEKLIELMQAGYMMSDIEKRDARRQPYRHMNVLNTNVEEER